MGVIIGISYLYVTYNFNVNGKRLFVNLALISAELEAYEIGLLFGMKIVLRNFAMIYKYSVR